MKNKTWEDKAHRLIYDLCQEEYEKKNLERKRHVPYHVPSLAQDLIECIKYNKEEEAKYIFHTRF